MSEQENQPTTTSNAAGTPEPAPAPLAEAVARTIPEPEREFAYTDTHTTANTPMKECPTPGSAIKAQLDFEVQGEKGYSTVYLGNRKEDHDRAQLLIGRWLGYSSIAAMNARGEIKAETFAVAQNDWSTFLESEYPGRTSDEMSEMAASLYKFFQGLQDPLLTRTTVVHEKNISNLSRRSSSLFTPEIVARVPGSNNSGLSISEQMVRGTLRESASAYHYTCLLRNSFHTITWVRPNRLDMANLVNDINRRVTGYVRQVGGNSIALAYVAGLIEVWNFIKSRIISTSIKGVVDFADLAKVIVLPDFQVLCTNLLASVVDDGVQMDLRCIDTRCNWHEFDLVDPLKMVNIRYDIQTEEEAAILGNIFADRVGYTIDEVLAMVQQSSYGLDNNKVYNESRTVCLTVAPPSIADAIASFEYFVAEVDPQLQDLRRKVRDERALEEQTALILNGIGAAEFIHWVSEFTILPRANEDGQPIVFKRSECTPAEFNRGLMESIKRDDVLNENFTRFVYTKTPYMTRTFVGLRNYECPKCKTRSNALQEEERQLGYTPIDAFMTFFTHIQLMLMNLALERQSVTNEARS